MNATLISVVSLLIARWKLVLVVGERLYWSCNIQQNVVKYIHHYHWCFSRLESRVGSKKVYVGFFLIRNGSDCKCFSRYKASRVFQIKINVLLIFFSFARLCHQSCCYCAGVRCPSSVCTDGPTNDTMCVFLFVGLLCWRCGAFQKCSKIWYAMQLYSVWLFVHQTRGTFFS